ncbi:unnamed protein product [Caenorhabditis angaria]|uniref:Serpentine Receptor, class H n=1 Tax=Caenorhabditis angaria TaxID=860376 RepID=A0A9P1IS46_9PELO|nr:unnamed protein product [Caenorhabditis angaria]
MFPAIAGYPIGYFTSWGVSTPIQTAMTLFFISGCILSITCLLLNRYNLIRHRRCDYLQNYLFGIGLLVTSLAILISLSQVPEQRTALPKIYEYIPCFPIEHRNHPIFVMNLDGDLIGALIVIIVFGATAQLLYFLFASIYHLTIRNQQKVSAFSTRTRNLQKAFFYSISLQIFIPIFIIFFPWIYVGISCVFDYYNQALNNLVTLDCGFHGIVSSISMLAIHKPYRDAVIKLMMGDR